LKSITFITPVVSRTLLGLFLSCVLAYPLAHAQPWIPPGDLALRHDLQLLADSGIIKAPINAWPLSWGDIARDIGRVDPAAELNVNQQLALERLRSRAEVATRGRKIGGSVRASVAEDGRILRTFEDTPREEAELTGGFNWTGDRFAANLQVTAVEDPSDDKDIRFDGSYFGVALGNWMISANAMDRWWGPGHEGSLILSNNARPIPAISFQRNYSRPVDINRLRWVGPWTAQIIYGFLEEDRAVPNAHFVGMRLGFRPIPKLEVGLSRTAQWCGDGRPCDLDTFLELLSGIRDNIKDPDTRQGDPGNQLAGYDLRYAQDILGRSYAIYAQMIGEDEAGGLPSQYLGMIGLETNGHFERLRMGFRIHAEWADTRCGGVSDTSPALRCAYNHGTYRTGYRYRGRVIGHAAEGDGLMFSLGGLFVSESGNSWNALARRVVLNLGNDPRNTIVSEKTEVLNLELSHKHTFRFGEMDFGVGYDWTEDKMTGAKDNDARGFVQWRWSPVWK